MDIVERMMGDSDDDDRYKHIVENCLYWSDINSVNIHIGKKLLDPEGKCKLKYNLGDTLRLDITKKWGVKGFDYIIGNPPFNGLDPSDKKKVNLYDKFSLVITSSTSSVKSPPVLPVRSAGSSPQPKLGFSGSP